MGLINMHYADGQTPLDEDEKEGLLIPSISTRSELDEAEQRNIEDAIRWTIERRKRFHSLFCEREWTALKINGRCCDRKAVAEKCVQLGW